MEYVCRCGARDVRLWRHTHVWLGVHVLLCRACATVHQAERIAEMVLAPPSRWELAQKDRIGDLVPAVPTSDETTFYGCFNIPSAALEQWRAMPDTAVPS